MRCRIPRSLVTLAATLVLAVPASAQTATDKRVTFSKDVAPILQAKCQECHQPNSIAPMSLMTFKDARPWARSIKERVTTRQMPPWHIDPSVGVQKFKNDMSLSDEQIDTIVRWVDGGAPEGDPKDLPPAKPLVTTNEWQGVRDGFGPPDLVIKSPEFTMPAQHQDVWFRPTSTIPLTEPRWIRMVEIRPTNLKARKIVHHSIAYQVLRPDNVQAVNTGTATGSFRRDQQPGRSRQPPAADHGVGDRQGLRSVPRRHRQADHAGRDDLLGSAHPRRGRRDRRAVPSWGCGSIRKARSRRSAAI